MIKGFKEFIARGSVVDLAVAVVIGSVFAAVIKAFVADIVTPLIAAIAGKPDFSRLNFTVHHSRFPYGDLINNVVTFLTVAAVIYLLVVVPLEKAAERRARGVAPVVELPADVALLTEIRDLLAHQVGDSPNS